MCGLKSRAKLYTKLKTKEVGNANWHSCCILPLALDCRKIPFVIKIAKKYAEKCTNALFEI